MSGAAWQLSGFGDEIDAAPEVQLAVLSALGASHIEVRSAWNVNILDLSTERVTTLAAIIRAADVAVSAVASPIGKVDVGCDTDEEIARLSRVIAAARQLDARFIRVFSFFCRSRGGAASCRDEVLTKMAALTRVAEDAGVVLIHENEKEIYGDTPERVLDLIESIGSSALQIAWDSANFVQVGVEPFAHAYPMLAKHIAYIQIKDALMATGQVVPPGSGDGDIAQIVSAQRDAGYCGFVSLEPHLAESATFGGFSGPRLFGLAARRFRAVAENLGVELV